MKKYRVDIGAIADVSDVVIIEAESEEEARRLAVKTCVWEIDLVRPDTVEIYNVTEMER